MAELSETTASPTNVTAGRDSGGSPSRDARSGVRAMLQGASYEDGARMLAPVQRKDEGAPAATGPIAERDAEADAASQTFRNIVPKVHLVFEQLTHALTYEDALSQAMQDDLHAWGYERSRRAISGRHGLQLSCFVPDAERAKDDYVRQLHGGKVRPVMAFRGTDGSGDLESDLGEGGIGRSQWLANEALIRDHLDQLAARGKVVVSGHSLGGALAQLTAALYPGKVGELVTFQSPGIPASVVAQLRAHNDTAKPKDQVPSTHYQVGDDIINAIGADYTPGVVVKVDREEGGALDSHRHLIGRSVTDEEGGAWVDGDPTLGGAGAVQPGQMHDPDVDGAAGQDQLASVRPMSTDAWQAGRDGNLEAARRTTFSDLLGNEQEVEADALAEARKRALAGERWTKIVEPIDTMSHGDIAPEALKEMKRKARDQVQTLFRDLWLAEQVIAGRLAANGDMLGAVASAFADQRARPLTDEERARADRYLRRHAGARYTSTQPASEAPAPQATEDAPAPLTPMMDHAVPAGTI